MGKYKSLISNTVLFAVGTFSSRLLTLLIMPLLTYLLAPEEFSGVKNAMTICNFILPIMYLSVSEAVIRFGLDKDYKKTDVFTISMLVVLVGYGVFLCLMPLLSAWNFIDGYQRLIAVFVLTSASHTVINHYVRASGLVRIFALDGMFTSVATVTFVWLFIVQLKLGAGGYMLATICADGLSALGLLLSLRLYRFFRLKGIDWATARAMLRYSVPLVPTALLWWVVNLSSQLFVTNISGAAANGVYAIANQIPTMITLVSAVFTQAWQVSAFTEYRGEGGRRFYSNVFRSYYSLVFLAAAGIILLMRPVTALLYDVEYYASWQYSLFLVLGVSFSCLVTFLGTIYNVVKKNGMVMVTTAVGAALNLALNFLLIPKWGPLGAAVSTFLSYFTVFVIRAIDTRRYIKIDMQPLRIGGSLLLLLGQIAVSLTQPKWGMLWQVLLVLALALCNLGYLLFMFQRLWAMAMGLLKRRSQA